MTVMHASLLQAIQAYRETHAVTGLFAQCLARLEDKGFSLLRDPDASAPDVRHGASALIVHCIASALDDHRISPTEMDSISALKRIYAIEEGDLLALQKAAIHDLLSQEMQRILADEQVDRAEALLQSDLQRALDLGYDDYLRLTRSSLRPVVERLLAAARESTPGQQRRILRKLQKLETVLRIDPSTLTAIWTN
ncbi:hypothetical protein [Stenotrophomonas mori]|uniref:Co-chaperone DjlA N-terminal domain-containing protein n=1 Tax=Stenotrophomonas mori TaxID=2871096 RepID=A0ABT0SH61_9GAMM|nr:hypothetical protein [Stenotrophomonas mori]MCL7714441.1 hypothetical protein [Stenotrophomonas mori]